MLHFCDFCQIFTIWFYWNNIKAVIQKIITAFSLIKTVNWKNNMADPHKCRIVN